MQGVYKSRGTSDLPKPPKEAIKVFKDAIEFVDKQSSKAISELVQFYQVHNSRLSKYSHKRKEYEQGIINVIRLNHFTIRTFDYARNETWREELSAGSPTYDDSIQSLKSLFDHKIHSKEDNKKYEDCVRILEKSYKVKT